MRVVLVEPDRLDILYVSVGGDVVAGEVVVDNMAEATVHHALLMQRHGEAHRHAADELRARGTRVDDPTHGEEAEQPGHADLARIDIDPDLSELRAEGMDGELLRLL